MEDLKPITGLAWISDRSGCPSGFNMIATSDGAPGNFAKGFNQKFAVHLCYSTTPESLDQVVTDVVVVNDEVSLPIGYAYISEYIDPKVSVSKKKKLCVKTLPLSSAETVVCEIKLTMKSSKVGAPFVRIGEMSGLTLWCKKVSPTVLKPVPRPWNITTGIRALSLDPGNVAQPTRGWFPIIKFHRNLMKPGHMRAGKMKLISGCGSQTSTRRSRHLLRPWGLKGELVKWRWKCPRKSWTTKMVAHSNRSQHLLSATTRSASFKPNPPPENDPPQTNGRADLADNNIYSISAIDGIPFTTDPASVMMGSPGMKDPRIKTHVDFENDVLLKFIEGL